MANFINRVGGAAAGACWGAIHTGITVKQGIQKGLLVVGEGTSRVMYDIYSLDGFEKWSKALIANLRFASALFKLNGLFDECLKTLEAQKDLYYATLFIGSMKEFVGFDKTKGEYHFKLPAREKLENLSKIFLAIGNFFETGKFLQKYKVLDFPLCTAVANRLASVQVFTLRGKAYTVDDIPVLQTLCDKPKDFFIVLSSAIEIWRGTAIKIMAGKAKTIFEVENLCKVVGSMGKIVLIAFGRHYSKFIWFSVVDVTTQDVSLYGFIYKRARERANRFERPVASAA
jgi:hypothetical protein